MFDIVEGSFTCPKCGNYVSFVTKMKWLDPEKRRKKKYKRNDFIDIKDGEYDWLESEKQSATAKCRYCGNVKFRTIVKDGYIEDFIPYNKIYKLSDIEYNKSGEFITIQDYVEANTDQALVISSYPNTGAMWTCEHDDNNDISKLYLGTGTFNIDTVKDSLNLYDVIFVEIDENIRKALTEANIDFITVIPDKELFFEFMGRKVFDKNSYIENTEEEAKKKWIEELDNIEHSDYKGYHIVKLNQDMLYMSEYLQRRFYLKRKIWLV